MTYIGFLVVFLVVPILLLGVLQLQRPAGWRAWVTTGCLSGIALVYTTPWDNHLVALGIWTYDPQRVLGITLGWVPLEEYLFFVLQPILVGLWAMAEKSPLSSPGTQGGNGRRISLVILGALELIALGFWIRGASRGVYLSRILAWGLPPLALQIVVGGDRLWAMRRTLIRRWLPPTLWLWLADGIAIRAGIWTIEPAYTVGLSIAGLPLEEMVFFALTNLLVASGWTLAMDPTVSAQLAEMIRSAKLGIRAHTEAPLERGRR